MVEKQIERRGVENRRVLEAMRTVPRHLFIPEASRARAYEDRALPIGKGQTISQPYVVAVMTDALDPKPGDRVLEVGTGSGYQAAVLSGLVEQVYSIEIVPELAARARRTLAALGYDNVVVIAGDGYRGLPDEAPFDSIIVTAAPERIPEPLIEQLRVGGRLVIPVGGRTQKLRVAERTKDGLQTRTLFGVRFVPMTGEAQDKK
jgi:protein-L-isoaspartate(D-aspartate) O-methyltransferase